MPSRAAPHAPRPRRQTEVTAPAPTPWVPWNAEFIAGRVPGPEPPREWAPILRQLVRSARAPRRPPEWWTFESAYYGSVETRTDAQPYLWDGTKRPGDRLRPRVVFQLTLAGMGHYQAYGKPAAELSPGAAFFAVVPSRHRYYLPERSPGWTFAWLDLRHPYVVERIVERVRTHGPLARLSPESPFTAAAVSLIERSFRHDFRDRFEMEAALFELLIAFERLVHHAAHPEAERERLLDEIRAEVLANPRRPESVAALAARRGMTRSHFSRLFKERTGLTPARFATELRAREASRMLVLTKAPLKEIADALGFADVHHFSKVFRRFQHMSPARYRRSFA